MNGQMAPMKPGTRDRIYYYAASITLISTLIACFGCFDCYEPVMTRYGLVMGINEETSDTCSYRGIPYAAPPVEERRFRPPDDPEPWEGIRDASTFGSPCWQAPNPFDPEHHAWFGSEDCLTVNIWRPKKQGLFPVMVFIHGGSFLEGAGGFPEYRSGTLAGEHDMIVVTLSYRLGALGLLAHPRLAQEDPHGSSGNYAILDQIKALEWVKNNIARFGGDPDTITLVGQSAGAISACVLLATPLVEEGLFHRVIMQSGMCDDCLPLTDGFQVGEKVAEALGCPDGPGLTTCLRGAPALAVMTAYPHDPFKYFTSPYKPYIDGYVIRDQPLHILQEGSHHRVPAIAGCTRDEFTAFFFANYDIGTLPITWDQYALQLQYRYHELADELLTLYPPGSYETPIAALCGIEGDRWFRCRMRAAAMALSQYQAATYFYHFAFDDYLLGPILGATHGLEIPLLFDTYQSPMYAWFFPLGPGLKARDLSRNLKRYWTNFTYQGNPNGQGLPEWPRYDTKERKNLVLDLPVSVESDLLRDRCDFWDACGM